MKLKESLLPEIELIQDDQLRAIVLEFVEDRPDWLCDRASTSSGKYHPESENGPGGLIRHTKAVVVVLLDLMESLPQFDEYSKERDDLIAAAIIHDLAKYENEDSKYTSFDHPLAASKIWQEVCDRRGYIDTGVKDLVERHMGRWCTSKYSRATLPTPETFNQVMLHWADYIASRKYTHITFQ
jgi:hypothetical protein